VFQQTFAKFGAESVGRSFFGQFENGWEIGWVNRSGQVFYRIESIREFAGSDFRECCFDLVE
jgi:hypothetical protein